MNAAALTVRPAGTPDMAQVNRIVSACVISWNLPARVKRLAIGSYLYQAHDLEFLEIYAAVDQQDRIVGVAALEQTDQPSSAATSTGLALHGLYVDPAQHKQGVGQKLLEFSMQRARQARVSGLLVKAQSDANSYFAQQGFMRLPALKPDRDYPNTWWKPTLQSHCA